MTPLVVLDTNVLVAALRSRRGASFRVLKLVGTDRFDLALSVPLVFEYEDAAKRIARSAGLRYADVDRILDYLCNVGHHREIYYLWRPFLKDPGDDMVLELAVECGADCIVTHNIRDFAGIDEFGIRAVTPMNFLQEIRGLE